MKNRSLALFDFDGTITKKDTLIEFIKFVKGSFFFYFGIVMLLPVLMAFKAKLIDNARAKEIFIYFFLGKISKKKLKRLGEKFCEEKLPQLIRKKALEKIKWHENQGDDLAIVSASIREWIEPWSKSIKLICTELDFKNDNFTGKFATKNCYGIEKEVRIRENFNLKDYKDIYAYGDSSGDSAMLALASKKFYKYFK